MHTKICSVLTFVGLAIVLISCKGPEGPTGPPGPLDTADLEARINQVKPVISVDVYFAVGSTQYHDTYSTPDGVEARSGFLVIDDYGNSYNYNLTTVKDVKIRHITYPKIGYAIELDY